MPNMMQNLKFKPKAGYVYVVTNECLKLVKAKGIFRGKMVKAVKIGNAKDFTSRLGSLNTAVYENFDFHLGIKTDDVVGLEGIIHTALQDYRIYTRDGDATEFFACPLDEIVGRIKNLIVRGHKVDVEEYKGGKVVGRSGAKIRANIKRHEAAKAKVVKPIRKNIGKTKAFSFAEVEISNGAKLVFVPTGAEVTVAGDKKIEYKGTHYSLSGYCKEFMPRKNASGAYQGPKYFSYNGKSLLEIRNERTPSCGIEERWEGKTQLAKLIARRGGNEGAFGGILHYFSRMRPCVKTSKWRELLEFAGIKFDTKNYVINWAVAKNPL
jgi:hypothetical protein